MSKHKGPVAFVAGVHYPATDDGGWDDKRPLRADGDGFRDAEKDETLHNDAFHLADAELPVGGEN